MCHQLGGEPERKVSPALIVNHSERSGSAVTKPTAPGFGSTSWLVVPCKLFVGSLADCQI